MHVGKEQGALGGTTCLFLCSGGVGNQGSGACLSLISLADVLCGDMYCCIAAGLNAAWGCSSCCRCCCCAQVDICKNTQGGETAVSEHLQKQVLH